MESSTLVAHCGTQNITRADLRNLPVPESTRTFKPIPHHEMPWRSGRS